MGSGKTQSAINLMNSDTENNYIFITPFLSEVERVKKNCNDRKFYEPNFRTVEGKFNSKFDSLHTLLLNNKNIATTHALFKRSNDETRELIHSGNYILILDEVMDVVEQLQIKQGDIDILFDTGLISVHDGFVIWNEDKKDYDSRYNDIRDMARNKNLIIHNNTILIWTFPADIFKSFKEVYILTYLFDAQVQKYYYDMNNIQYEKYIATKENDTYIFKKNISHSDKQLKQLLKSKINIYDGQLNNIGDDDYSLSASWYDKKNNIIIKKVKNNVENYFKNILKSNSNFNMWTTFIKHKNKVKGRGYTKGFVSCTARATNDYNHKKHLSYTINRFVNPIIKTFFSSKGILMDDEQYALSEMIQWIWRSAIREGEEIDLYMPSKRMREILIKWLNDEL
jgi:hypothetical protein